MTPPADLSLACCDGYAILTLERGAKRNALTFAMRRGFADLLATIAADDALACAVIAGTPPDFCAGMDVNRFGGDAANRREIVESSTVLFGFSVDITF
jgi:enoyl-CoA hydratase/carnithine racemase